MFDFGFHFFGNSRSSTPPPPPPSDDFIIKVKTDNAGSGANQFTLPLPSLGTYDYTIDWGDGVVENHTTNTSKTHTYLSAGEYVITISGTFPTIRFNNGGDRLKLIEIINFGDVGWTSMASAFFGCSNMTINENATGNFSGVSNFSNTWNGCTSMTSFPILDLSSGTNFLGSWQNCTSLLSFPALDLSGGTNFGDAFSGAWRNCSSMLSFNATALGSGSYQNAWRGCSSLTSFPALDLSGGTNFTLTWFGCSSLESFPALDLSVGTNFNSAWRDCGVITSFATRNFYNMTSGSLCFFGSTLPTSDYSDILITQRANNNNNDVTFHGGNSKYNPAGGIARAELTDDVASGGQNWSILDGGAE